MSKVLGLEDFEGDTSSEWFLKDWQQMSTANVRVLLKFRYHIVRVVSNLRSILCFDQVCYDMPVSLTMRSNCAHPSVMFNLSPL